MTFRGKRIGGIHTINCYGLYTACSTIHPYSLATESFKARRVVDVQLIVHSHGKCSEVSHHRHALHHFLMATTSSDRDLQVSTPQVSWLLSGFVYDDLHFVGHLAVVNDIDTITNDQGSASKRGTSPTYL